MLNGIGLSPQGTELKESPVVMSEEKEAPLKGVESDAGSLGAALEQKEADSKGLAPEKEATPLKEEPLSSRFAALARKEKIALKRAQEVKAREAEIEAREAKLKELEESYSLGKKNPMEALKRLGWTYEDITNHILNDGKATPESEIKSLREEMSQWKKRQEDEKEALKKKEEEAHQASYAQAIENFKAEMKDFISTHSDTYELINLHEEEDLVYATIEAHYQATLDTGTPKILSNKEACDLVEKFLEDKLERETKTKKFQSKYSSQNQDKKEDKAQASTVKTLTNNMASSSTPSQLPARTEQERLQRALAALTK